MITGMPRIAIAVRDFDATVATFRDRLGMPVIDISESSVESLGAKLAMCVPEGGSNVELMCPARPETPLSQSLQKFLDRRGEGLFALMLEAPVPDEEGEELARRGLNVLPLMAGAGGRDVHPNSTHGVLVRVYPVNSFAGKAPAHAGDAGLSGIRRVIIAVRDLPHAVRVYGEMFAMDVSAPASDPERGVESAICAPGTGGVIELAAVRDGSRPFAGAVASFLEERPEGMYALVLDAEDPESVARVLAGRGLVVHPSADSGDVYEVSRDSAFGALIRIEPRD